MRIWLFIGALNGALAVTLGAVGSHALDPSLSDATRAVFETAVRYHFIHALALLGIAALQPYLDGRILSAAGISFTIGILLFCGGLYALSGMGIPEGARLAPLGGMLLITAWLILAAAALVRTAKH